MIDETPAAPTAAGANLPPSTSGQPRHGQPRNPATPQPRNPATPQPRNPATPVRERLLKAALECFLADDYHRVTTRLVAEKAGANVPMIRYYFGNKEGLYEEMGHLYEFVPQPVGQIP